MPDLIISNNTSAIDDANARAELAAIRAIHIDNAKADAETRKDATETVQVRQRAFLERGWKQARELMKPESRNLVTSLLADVNIEAAQTTDKLLEQIAFAQMCQCVEKGEKKGTWTVAGRRHERVGRIYRVFAKQDWSSEGLAERLKAYKGGTTKLLADNVFVDPADKQKREKRRARVIKDESAATVNTFYAPDREGKWEMALISFEGGQVRFHKILDKTEAEVMREVDAYCEKRSPEMAVEAEERADQAA